ncbi:hypothetical protein FGG78_35540 [Thioclava sp. BHET1]|nr:hypothetical protein FGG78_35540 [Thioclava sp. BHET1]
MSLAVEDEMQINRLILTLAMAIDDRDVNAYWSCLFEWIDTSLPGEMAELVRAEEYAQGAIRRASLTDWTHHRPAWPLLSADPSSDRAFGVVDFSVRMGWTDNQRRACSAIAGGRYYLRFLRNGDGWKLCGRATTWRYRDGDLPPNLN